MSERTSQELWERLKQMWEHRSLCDHVRSIVPHDNYSWHSQIMERQPQDQCRLTEDFLNIFGRAVERHPQLSHAWNNHALSKDKLKQRTYGFSGNNTKIIFRIVRHRNAFRAQAGSRHKIHVVEEEWRLKLDDPVAIELLRWRNHTERCNGRWKVVEQPLSEKTDNA